MSQGSRPGAAALDDLALTSDPGLWVTWKGSQRGPGRGRKGWRPQSQVHLLSFSALICIEWIGKRT